MKVLQPLQFEGVKYWKLGYHPFSSPRMYVHCFLIDGLLIDTGFPHISKEITSILQNESVEKIIVTHHHEDHAGNIETLKATLGVQAFGSKKCVELMKRPVIVEPARWLTWGQQGKADLISLEDSNCIDSQNFSFNIIEAPGHSEDQICLYEANKGWLFSADCYLDDHIQVFMRDEKMEDHIETIRKLLTLEFEVLFCSHNIKLSNGKAGLERKLQYLEDFFGRVKREYEKGKLEKEIMSALDIKEYYFIKTLSLGQLSRVNMVKSTLDAIRLSTS